MGDFYCKTHQRKYNHECPGCRADQTAEDHQSMIDGLSELAEATEASAQANAEAMAERTEEITRAIADAAWKKNNPGEYECPYCGRISLEYLRSKCSMCQSNISDTDWDAIKEKRRIADEKEALRKKVEAEEKAKRLKIAAEKEARRKKAAAEEEKESRGSAVALVFSLFVVCVIACIALGISSYDSPKLTQPVIVESTTQPGLDVIKPEREPAPLNMENKEDKKISVENDSKIIRRVRVHTVSDGLLNQLWFTLYEYTKTCATEIEERPDGEEVEMVFFKMKNPNFTSEDLEKEYEINNLTPDPYVLAAINQADESFSKDHPNATQWKNNNGVYEYIGFRHEDNSLGGSFRAIGSGTITGYQTTTRKSYICNGDEIKWSNKNYLWFGGVRKKPIAFG